MVVDDGLALSNQNISGRKSKRRTTLELLMRANPQP